jgi:hypothetical protein
MTAGTAVHEVGHAIARHRLGYDFFAVTIVPREIGDTGELANLGCLKTQPDGGESELFSAAELEVMDDDDWGQVYDDGSADDIDEVEFDDPLDRAQTEEKRAYRARWNLYEPQIFHTSPPEHDNIVSLAGPLAQAWHMRRPPAYALEHGGGGDLDNIKHRMGGSFSVAAMVALEIETAQLLSRDWPLVLAVADALMKRRTLLYPEFCRIIGEDENNRARQNPNYGRLQEPDRVPGSNTPPLDRPLPAAQPW